MKNMNIRYKAKYEDILKDIIEVLQFYKHITNTVVIVEGIRISELVSAEFKSNETFDC